MDYDPSYTLRDKPRRSSLSSHAFTVEKYVQNRRGSINGPLATNGLSLPVARRPSDALLAARRASEMPTSPTLGQDMDKAKAGRARSATTTSALTGSAPSGLPSWLVARLEAGREHAPSPQPTKTRPTSLLGLRGRSDTGSSIDSANRPHSRARSGTIASTLSPLAEVTSQDLNATAGLSGRRLSPESQPRNSLLRASFSSTKRRTLERPLSGAPQASPTAIEEGVHSSLSPVAEKGASEGRRDSVSSVRIESVCSQTLLTRQKSSRSQQRIRSWLGMMR